MGWYFTNGATLADVIREESGDFNYGDGRINHGVARKLSGNVLWQLREIVHEDLGVQDRFITCYLLARNGDSAGYKPMDESMHPCYYSCPLSWLDEVPEVNADWRAGVRAYWAHRKAVAALRPGTEVDLQGCVVDRVRLVRKRGRNWYGVANGVGYRIPASVIKLNA